MNSSTGVATAFKNMNGASPRSPFTLPNQSASPAVRSSGSSGSSGGSMNACGATVDALIALTTLCIPDSPSASRNSQYMSRPGTAGSITVLRVV